MDVVSARLRQRRDEHDRRARRPEPAGAASRRLFDSHGTGRPVADGDSGEGHRFVSGQCMAARADVPSARDGGAFRVGLPGATHGGHPGPRRTERYHRGFHRSPRLDRGVPSRGRLGRSRSDVGIVRRRGAHPLGVYAQPVERRSDFRNGRAVHDRVLVLEPGDPRVGGPPGHPAVYERAVGRRQRSRPPRGPAPRRG